MQNYIALARKKNSLNGSFPDCRQSGPEGVALWTIFLCYGDFVQNKGQKQPISGHL